MLQSTADVVSDGKVISFNYTLRTEDGEVLDTSEPGEPLAYLHGAENIVPGLEEQLTGHKSGDSFDATVKPEDGYGVRDPEGLRPIPREAFPEDAELEAGMELVLEDDEGNLTPIWIVDIRDEVVIIDTNHPLADITLCFSIEIVGIRSATASELEHGHPHDEHDGHGPH
jgi:FKBP-type peptidyl-prolyl cis-trans isomerase SlyD